MLISLYSGRSSWVMVPSNHRLTVEAITSCGSLILEGNVPSALISDDVWKRFQAEVRQQGFCQVSEDLGILLMDECVTRYGTLMMQDRQVPPRGRCTRLPIRSGA